MIKMSNYQKNKLATSMYKNTEKNTEKNTKKITEQNTEKIFCIFFCKIFCKFFRIFFRKFFQCSNTKLMQPILAIYFNIWAISCSNIEKIAIKLLFELHIWILKKIQKKIRKNLQKILQKKIQKNFSVFFSVFFSVLLYMDVAIIRNRAKSLWRFLFLNFHSSTSNISYFFLFFAGVS